MSNHHLAETLRGYIDYLHVLEAQLEAIDAGDLEALRGLEVEAEKLREADVEVEQDDSSEDSADQSEEDGAQAPIEDHIREVVVRASRAISDFAAASRHAEEIWDRLDADTMRMAHQEPAARVVSTGYPELERPAAKLDLRF